MEYECSGFRVTAYLQKGEACPIVYVPVFDNEEAQSLLSLREHLTFSLVTIQVRDWNADLSPWAAPELQKNEPPFAGRADHLLRCLINEILPRVEGALLAVPTVRCLAGYSMAGLFALYAMYRTDVFRRIASASGSLWYPSFLSFAKTQTLCCKPERIVLSLGDREGKTRHPVLHTVEENTIELVKSYREAGSPVSFHWNVGNHFTDPAGRLAKAIAEMLKS